MNRKFVSKYISKNILKNESKSSARDEKLLGVDKETMVSYNTMYQNRTSNKFINYEKRVRTLSSSKNSKKNSIGHAKSMERT